MIKIGRREKLWAFLSQASHAGSNLLLLPLLLSSLSSNEIAQWYLFIALGALGSLVDFGFQSNISRFFTFCKIGCEDITKEGGQGNLGNPNYELMKHVLSFSDKLYLVVGLVVLAILALFGTTYLNKMVGNPENISWLIYGFSILISVRYAYFKPMLRGLGYIELSHKGVFYSKLVYVLLSILGLIFFGLLGICVALLISNVFYRVYSYRIMRGTPEYIKMRSVGSISRESQHKFKGAFFHNSSRVGVSAIGEFIDAKIIILICPLFFTTAQVAQLGVLFQLLSAGVIFCCVLINVYSPKITELRNTRSIKDLKSIVAVQSLISIFMYVCGVGLLLIITHFDGLSLMGSNVSLDLGLTLVVVGYFLFNLIGMIFKYVLIAISDFWFVRYALMTSVASAAICAAFAYSGVDLTMVVVYTSLPYLCFYVLVVPMYFYYRLRSI